MLQSYDDEATCWQHPKSTLVWIHRHDRHRSHAADPFEVSSRVHEVRIEVAAADWEMLRKQHHDLMHPLGPARLNDAASPSKPYTRFRCSVPFNGAEFPNVSVRKRGLLGSTNPERPSLNLDFDHHESSGRYEGHPAPDTAQQ